MKRMPADSTNDRELNQRLDSLLALYRDALPDQEPGPEFFPKLWRQIEARKAETSACRKWAEAFLAAAMALSLLLGGLLVQSGSRFSSPSAAAVPDEVADDNGSESVLYAEVVAGGTGNHR